MPPLKNSSAIFSVKLGIKWFLLLVIILHFVIKNGANSWNHMLFWRIPIPSGKFQLTFDLLWWINKVVCMLNFITWYDWTPRTLILYWDFILMLSRFYPNFILILSRFHPDFIQISSRFHPDFLESHFIQILSRFYPDFIWIKSG